MESSPPEINATALRVTPMAGAVRADILEATGAGWEKDALLASLSLFAVCAGAVTDLRMDMESTVIENRGE